MQSFRTSKVRNIWHSCSLRSTPFLHDLEQIAYRGIKIYAWYMSWLCGPHSLWWDALLSLHTLGRGLVLPQLKYQAL